MIELKYSKILQENKKLGNNLTSSSYAVRVSSNIIVHQIKEILEYLLRAEGINANVAFGDYDNIVQDSQRYKDANTVIIFWELCNIIDGLQYKIELLNDDERDKILEKIKTEINLVLKNLEKASLGLINKFTSLAFSYSSMRKNCLDELASQLNNYLEENIPSSVKLVDLEKVIANVGVSNSLDLRYYYSSKALYTIDFFKFYAEYVKPFIMSANGKAKKALIFDCDNTLWKGILGEDGFDNIEMSASTKDGAIFAEIQSMTLSLNGQGILIGLCSKNNPGDVDEVLASHPDMQLRNEHITINKSNWSNKVTNLKKIAKELNIGLDSLVFVDDSSFEVNLIKEHLPEVTVLQVPKRLYKYPNMLRENLGHFYNLSFTSEDRKKIEMYKQQVKRETVKKEFTDIEDYLSSLDLKMTIFENEKSIIPRMSQMSQKTNQFNLTTKRYTESDIRKFIDNPNSDVYAFSLADKLGDSGVTGLSIVTTNGSTGTAEIDTLLVSCRVIGRKIEYAFLDYVLRKTKEIGIDEIKAKYITTRKNEQVKEFYDKYSFELINESDTLRNYTLDLSQYDANRIDYIEVVNGK
jgi:FkbH-like protein|tara:strand:- start:322 stop:2061 length:1740 start_codon:yes stop_codon:yes gene_type:complete